MTQSLSSVCHPHANSAPRTFPRATLRTALTVWTQRRELARLSSARLVDLGITPEQAATEAARPFWDFP